MLVPMHNLTVAGLPATTRMVRKQPFPDGPPSSTWQCSSVHHKDATPIAHRMPSTLYHAHSASGVTSQAQGSSPEGVSHSTVTLEPQGAHPFGRMHATKPVRPSSSPRAPCMVLGTGTGKLQVPMPDGTEWHPFALHRCKKMSQIQRQTQVMLGPDSRFAIWAGSCTATSPRPSNVL